jgi:outer membrane usher protein
VLLAQAVPGQRVPVRIPQPAMPASPQPASVPLTAPAPSQSTSFGGPAKPATTPRPPLQPPGSGKINVWGREITIVVPVREAGSVYGAIPLRISVDDVLEVPVDQLATTLGDAITPETRAALLAAGGPSGRVRLDQLSLVGLDARYDTSLAAVFVSRTGTARPATEISLADFRRDRVEGFDPPARVSAYLSTRATVGWQHVGEEAGFEGLDLASTFAARFGSVVFETDATARFTGDTSDVTRSYSRFVHDQAKTNRRWLLGDVDVESQGYMSAPPLLGLQLQRRRAIFDPVTNLRPTSFEAFQINRDSEVDIIVNGQVQRRIRLAPGRYTLTDFPFTSGSNNVQIVATDRTGRQETTRFNRFYDFSLLQKGETEYGLSFGIASEPSAGGPRYDSDRPIASALYRRGYTDYLTAGVGLQADRHVQLAAIDGVMAQSYGTMQFAGSLSNDSRLGVGGAATATFQRLLQRDAARRTLTGWTVGGELQSKNFSAIGRDTAATSLVAARAFATVNFDFTENQIGSFSINWERRRGGLPDAYSAQAAFGVRLWDSVFLNVLTNYRSEQTTGSQFGVGLSLSFRFGRSTFVTSGWDSTDDRYDIGVSRLGTRQVGSTTYSARVSGAPGGIGFNGGISGTTNKLEYSLDHSTAYQIDSSEIGSSRSSLTGSAAIAVADGTFAFGRPIADSFAIISGHESLKSASIEIDSSQSRFVTRSDRLGPALLTDLSSYTDRTFTVSAPEAPVGYDLGRGSFRVRAPYRSGYAFKVGSDYVVTVVGLLRDERGERIGLTRGRVTLVDQSDQRTVDFFTNSRGQFGLVGLKPGKWRAQTEGDRAVTFEFVVPAGAEGLVRIGEVQGTP